ncbi:Nif3-like dinuclear metal center hexameric protein [Saccharibacillus sp. JS10]|uniref:Nif3-like dinuclear metal center hexameric protein n=1 Tax=Saccharibacillus sp. JS10 TaxID=2950552 RepID=UPI002109AFF1|nr:Nif3-like dinuclear metal center hexameric protein [Saccharibacillus sp. JS10]MCQ4088059.1 Nif3-like dinuclear metal center hexameric protein [Saccharibacillus sp. JS10]
MDDLELTIQNVIDVLYEKVEASLPEPSVDRLLIGNTDSVVTGIVTTFMPTTHVIEQAAQIGANLVIGHEGLFFSHHERSPESPELPVERIKRQRIQALDVAVFRCHDLIHRYRPDAITEGLIQKLNWNAYVHEHRPETAIVHLPTQTLEQIVATLKKELNIPYVRVMGDLEKSFSKVAVSVGYRGGGSISIPILESGEAQLIICGEGPEWETPEYVRERLQLHQHGALIVLGHAESETPGMEFLAAQLRHRFPTLPIHHIQEAPIFQVR